jgi:hypothetical protein
VQEEANAIGKVDYGLQSFPTEVFEQNDEFDKGLKFTE